MSNMSPSLLSKTVLRIDEGESLAERLKETRSRRATHIAVFAKGHCLGVASSRVVDWSSGEPAIEKLLNAQRWENVGVDSSVESLCQAFADPNLDALIVRNAANEFAGVVTRQSLLEALAKERRLVSDVSGKLAMTEHERAQSLLAGEKRILEVISTSSSHDGGLTELVEFVEAQSGSVACAIMLVDEVASRLRNGASPNLPSSIVDAIDGMSVGVSTGVCGRAAFLNQVVAVTDIATDPLCESVRDLALEHEFQACCASPINSSSGRVLGTISLYFKNPQHLDDFHAALMDRAVYLAAIALERKHAEDALLDSEARNRSLLEGSPICTKIIDLDSKLQYMSAAGIKQLKICNIRPFYGRTFPPDLYPEDWRPLVAEHLERAKAGTVSSLECPVRDTDGKEVWFDTTFMPACDENGAVQYVIVTSVDVTERRHAEEAARQHRDELAHVARLSTMGELATGIAHELNQPLSAISSYSFAAKSIAAQSSSRVPGLQDVLGKLEQQAIRAGDIVRRLREFVTKSESTHLRVDLSVLIQDVVALLGPDLENAGVTLKLMLNEPAPKVLVDKIQIQQVLVNLIRNALDAMDAQPAESKAMTISTRILSDGQAEVTVADSGVGLDQDDSERVFNTFFSTKQEGMGMGLPISRSIVESHGGKLWSKSNRGPGATFGFTIQTEDSSEGAIVYIVDDDPSIRDSMSMVVQVAGFNVKCYSSASEFLDVVDEWALSKAVCLIADLQMPDMDGMELAAKLNSQGIETPVILITGHGTEALKQKAAELGAVALLEKPFRPAVLQEIVSAQLAKDHVPAVSTPASEHASDSSSSRPSTLE